MPIRFKCPSCGQSLGIAKRKAGTVVSCPKCSYPATVPQDEDVERTEAPASLPLFEQQDFDRWIGRRGNGSAAAAAHQDSGVAVAPPPAERHAPRVSASPIESSPRLALAPTPARSVAAPKSTAPTLDLRLAIGVALLTGAVGFIAGMSMNRNSSGGSTASESRGNGAPAPIVNKSEKAAPTENPTKQAAFTLNGRVQWKVKGELKPDAGATVLVFPTAKRPIRKFQNAGLRPGDGQVDAAGVEQLRRNGGQIATTDAEGRYAIGVDEPGAYWVVVLSKNSKVEGPNELSPDEKGIQDFFADVAGLLGSQSHGIVIRRTRDGESSMAPFNPVFP